MASSTYVTSGGTSQKDDPWASQQLAFYQGNKPGDRYQQFKTDAGGWGDYFLNTVKNMGNPWETGAEGFRKKFGFSTGPDITTPGTQGKLREGMSFLSGELAKILEENQRKTAGISMAGSRFGPAGGAGTASTPAQLAAQTNQTIAGQTGSNIKQLMDWETQKAALENEAARAGVGLFGQQYGTNVSAGQQSLSQVLAALQSQGREESDWLGGAGAALGRDVDWQNRFKMESMNDDVEKQIAWQREMLMRQEAQRRQAQSDANYGRLGLKNMINQISTAGQSSMNIDPAALTAIQNMNRLLLDPEYMAYNRGGNPKQTPAGTQRGPVQPGFISSGGAY